MNTITTPLKTRNEQGYFLSEILGAKVLMHGKKIGRLNDLVIKENGTLPVVTHLFIGRPFGETSLVSWEAVKSFAAKAIEIDVDLARCEKEPEDRAILLRDNILDKKALDMDGHEVEVVYDVRLVDRNHKLYVSDVDLSRYGLLRRMGLKGLANFIYKLAESIQEQTISWKYIQPLPSRLGRFHGDVQLNVLKEALSDMQPVDVADILEELDHDQRVAIFEELEPEHASDTLEEISPNVQRDLVSSLKVEKAAQLINEMTPAQAADVLAVLPGDVAKDILELLEPENIQKIQPILEQQEQNILNYATLDILKVSPEMTAEQVQDQYRVMAQGKDVIMYLYVVDAQDRLLGVLDVKELLQSDSQACLRDIMIEQVISLDADSTLREASAMFTRYGFRAIPVLNEQRQILGVVTYRDVMNLKHRFIE